MRPLAPVDFRAVCVHLIERTSPETSRCCEEENATRFAHFLSAARARVGIDCVNWDTPITR